MRSPSTATAGSASTTLRGGQRAARSSSPTATPARGCTAGQPGRRQGLPLQPVRGPRRAPRVHDVQPDRPQVDVHLHRDRARTGSSSSNAPTPAPEEVTDFSTWYPGGIPDHQADVDVHHQALIAGGLPPRARHLRRQERHHPARPLLPPEPGRPPRPRRGREDHQGGLRVLRGGLQVPVPVREVRPALRADCRPGRDGDSRRRTLRDEYLPRGPPGRIVLRVPPHLGDPATRWPTCGSATSSPCSGGTTSG